MESGTHYQNQHENDKPAVLGEELIHGGPVKRTRRYLRGWHPDRGLLTVGWSGKETIEEIEGVTPIITVTVYENRKRPNTE